MKDDKHIYSSVASSEKKSTRKECLRALEYILKHGVLPEPYTAEMDYTKRGK